MQAIMYTDLVYGTAHTTLTSKWHNFTIYEELLFGEGEREKEREREREGERERERDRGREKGSRLGESQ